MFLLLTRILLWLLIGTIFYRLLLNIIPRKYLTWFGGLVLFIFVVLSFINPAQSTLVSNAWAILSFPFTPLGLSILLLMIALRGGVKKVSGNQVMAALLVLVLSSLPIVAYNLAQASERGAVRVERRAPFAAQTQATGKAGAIIVQAREGAQANLPSSETNSRLNYAAQLYKQQSGFGNPPLVIVSTNRDPNDISRQLGRSGVPASQIIVERRSADLRSAAEETDQILKSRGVTNRRVIIVSPALTSRRATLTFANLGLMALPQSTDFFSNVGGAARSLRVENFVPNIQALTVTTRVVEEFLVSLYYFLRGWQAPAPSFR